MTKDTVLSVRVTVDELKRIKEQTKKFGFSKHSEYARYVLLNLKDIKIEL